MNMLARKKLGKTVKLTTVTSLSALMSACTIFSSQETHVGTDGADVMTGTANTNDIFLSSLGADRIDGVSGVANIFGRNLIDYSGSNAGVKITLDGVTVGVGGHGEGDVLLNINNATGSAFDDELTGNAEVNKLIGANGNDKLSGLAGNDTLIGGLGADVLDGGEGRDTADYSDSLSGIAIDLAAGTATGGEAEGDTFISIEIIKGGEFADTLKGDVEDITFYGGGGNDVLIGGAGSDSLSGEAGNDQIEGGAGNDQIYGGDGNDRLDGGAGDDNLIGEAGDDVLIGGAGDDFLSGGMGADNMQGGDGIDTISYADSTAGVNVNLALLTASGGDAAGDVISSIENVSGSRFDDVLIGSDADNVLSTYSDGFDKLDGGAGVDKTVVSIGYFQVALVNPMKLSIIKDDNKIAFDFHGHEGELKSIEFLKYSDNAGTVELDMKDVWSELAADEQSKFSDETDFLNWLGDDAGYNYEGL
ncbi:MAG: hypothetical protein COB24_11105 [Hyphomicrobiales bacterium]|nr:MAG: hypothetical protein COB24_11105 [Hyphomicrobiales bacterium]